VIVHLPGRIVRRQRNFDDGRKPATFEFKATRSATRAVLRAISISE